MNAILLRDRIDFYNDLTRNARFFSQDYNNAVNSAILMYIDQILVNAKNYPSGFQYSQYIRDRLFSLIKVATPSITNSSTITGRYGTFTPSFITYPADYQNFVELNVLIDGYSDYSRPTDYNESGPLLDNIFMKPTNQKTYYNESTTGIVILRGVGGTFSSCQLVYLKTPATYNVGYETNWINPGGSALVNASSYIALETSVQNAITYQSGAQFTATGTSLTSGKVILASNTTTCDLPDATHDAIAKSASQILLGVTANYPASQFVEKEAAKNN